MSRNGMECDAMRWGRDAMDGLGRRCDVMKNTILSAAFKRVQRHGQHSKITGLAAAPTSSASGRGSRTPAAASPAAPLALVMTIREERRGATNRDHRGDQACGAIVERP